MAEVQLASADNRIPVRRTHIAQATIAVVVLTASCLLAGLQPLSAWWFWVGATAALTAAVVQPYFTGPSSAVPYGLAGVGAYASADRTDVETVWLIYLIVAGLVITTSVLALAAEPGRMREMAHWFSTRLGRPVNLGFGALAIETLRLGSNESIDQAGMLAIGVSAAMFASMPDWHRLMAMIPAGTARISTVETAIEPNVVLVSGTPRLAKGTSVMVHGRSEVLGVVVSNMAHKRGNRAQIVLNRPWTDVAASSGERCRVEIQEGEPDPPIAFATEGTNESALVLHPFSQLDYGDTVRWDSGDRSYLYQVTELRLEKVLWDSSAVIESRASASLLGSVRNGRSLESEPALPLPYQPVRSANTCRASLPDGYSPIGKIAGTAIPFGVSASEIVSHHLALLGMSGMGKTTAARRLTDVLSKESLVVAMDGTGEYRTRFGLSTMDPKSASLISPGCWVYEPKGSLAQRATEFIEQLMATANREYQAGDDPLRRTLLLEEAHSFLPEWNFAASRDEPQYVAKSCRYLLQARKFGLGFILVSQRTAVISKSALSQCESYILFRTVDPTGLEYIEGIAGRAMRAAAPNLARYQAICAGPAFSTTSPVIVDLDPY